MTGAADTDDSRICVGPAACYVGILPSCVQDESEVVTKLSDEFITVRDERLAHPETVPAAGRLYAKFADKIKIGNAATNGTAYYSSGAIYFNQKRDINDRRGPASSFFHETGHLLDDAATEYGCLSAKNEKFKAALKTDVEGYIGNYMKTHSCTRDEAMFGVSSELRGDDKAGVSDIFGALTDCKCQGNWGHSRDYWKYNVNNFAIEAFANMFEASVGEKKKAEIMKHFLPDAYNEFLNMIEEASQ